MLFKRISAALGLLLVLGFISGCASNVVKLNYVPVGAMLQSTGKTAVLLELEDRRPNTSGIGQRKNGELFTGDATVTDWVSRALADELTRQGVSVSYAGGGLSSPGARVISGSLESLWLKETGNTSYEVEMKMHLTLTDSNGKLIYQNNFQCWQNAQFLPTESKISDLMADSLHDLVFPAAQTIGGKL